LEILSARGIPLEQCEEPNELVTPTGAAIIAEFAESFGPIANLTPHQVGYGLGTRDNITRPNVLRVILGEQSTTPVKSPEIRWSSDTVTVLETNLDDCQPEWIGDFYATALDAGALDISVQQCLMKKNRPGWTLQIICHPDKKDALAELIFRHTSAIGIRISESPRYVLKREMEQIATPFGVVQVKTAWLGSSKIQSTPEYESVKRIALARGVPIKEVYQAVQKSLD
jgi:uncharacterized protein (DUF111 family)